MSIQLINQTKALVNQESSKKENPFNKVPKFLLQNIGAYLSLNDIAGKVIWVSREFQANMKDFRVWGAAAQRMGWPVRNFSELMTKYNEINYSLVSFIPVEMRGKFFDDKKRLNPIELLESTEAGLKQTKWDSDKASHVYWSFDRPGGVGHALIEIVILLCQSGFLKADEDAPIEISKKIINFLEGSTTTQLKRFFKELFNFLSREKVEFRSDINSSLAEFLPTLLENKNIDEELISLFYENGIRLPSYHIPTYIHHLFLDTAPKKPVMILNKILEKLMPEERDEMLKTFAYWQPYQRFLSDRFELVKSNNAKEANQLNEELERLKKLDLIRQGIQLKESDEKDAKTLDSVSNNIFAEPTRFAQLLEVVICRPQPNLAVFKALFEKYLEVNRDRLKKIEIHIQSFFRMNTIFIRELHPDRMEIQGLLLKAGGMPDDFTLDDAIRWNDCFTPDLSAWKQFIGKVSLNDKKNFLKAYLSEFEKLKEGAGKDIAKRCAAMIKLFISALAQGNAEVEKELSSLRAPEGSTHLSHKRQNDLLDFAIQFNHLPFIDWIIKNIPQDGASKENFQNVIRNAVLKWGLDRDKIKEVKHLLSIANFSFEDLPEEHIQAIAADAVFSALSGKANFERIRSPQIERRVFESILQQRVAITAFLNQELRRNAKNEKATADLKRALEALEKVNSESREQNTRILNAFSKTYSPFALHFSPIRMLEWAYFSKNATLFKILIEKYLREYQENHPAKKFIREKLFSELLKQHSSDAFVHVLIEAGVRPNIEDLKQTYIHFPSILEKLKKAAAPADLLKFQSWVQENSKESMCIIS